MPPIRRNHVIADVLLACKSVEKAGIGFEKIVEDYKKYSDEYQSVVTSVYGHLTLTLKDVNYVKEESINKESNHLKLPKNQRLVYETVLNNPGLRTPALNDLCILKEKSVENTLSELKNKKVIEYRGNKKDGGYYVV